MAAEPGTVQFSIGRVFGDSFGVYARNFVSFTALALVIGLVSLVFQLVILTPMMIAGTQDPARMNWGLVFFGSVIPMVVNAVTQATIIYGTFQDLRGQRAGIGACIARGLSSIVPVIIGSILLSLAVGIGFVLIFVPGLILLIMWWVYIPAIVVESKGMIEAFGRSRELTRGRRWHILGIALIVGIVTIVISLAIGKALQADATGQVSTVGSIIQYAFLSVLTAFNAVLVAVGYYYLRAEKEGTDVNAIASIFD
jgi:hypothetical protein